MKRRKFSLFTIVWVVYVVFVLVCIQFGTKAMFNKDSKSYLTQISKTLGLEFELGTEGQIPLVLQMAKSPVTRSYFENLQNEEIKALALEQIEAFQNSFLSKSSFWVSDADHAFYSDMQYTSTLDISDPSNYWYIMTRDSADDYNFNINYNADLNVTNLWVNAVVRNKAGKGVGICGTGIPLTVFIDKMYSALPEGLEMFLYNADGEITAAKDSKIVADKQNISSQIPLKSVPFGKSEFVKARNGVYQFESIDSIGWNMVIFRPFGSKEILSNMYVPLIISIVVAFFIVIFQLYKLLMNPLKLLKRSIDDFSSGNADLTKRIDLHNVSSLQVISNMCDGFNAFISKIQDIVANVKDSKDELMTSGSKLRASTDETMSSIGQIMNNISDFGNNIQSQVESVESSAGAVQEISANIDSLGKMITEQTNCVNTASSAITQMVSNISSVNNSVDKLYNKFTELERQSKEGVDAQRNMNERMIEIQNQSEMLQTANAAISNIASQTNLLAMNAAIEAAHAGDAGKGFSVVADEIRKLSETSSVQSHTISQQLDTIKSSIENIVQATELSSAAFSNVNADIHETNVIVQEITDAMREQEQGSKQITEALSLVNNTTSEVNSSSYEMSTGSKAVLEGIRNLQETTHLMRQKMDEMSMGAERISEVSTTLDALSSEVSVSIEKINSKVDEFIV
ncbi:MAG: methyl-accepting chemotaxis protein [Treponema sp.]|nr:methyl-accepting chemotaxis protein [Treponema sp.]